MTEQKEQQKIPAKKRYESNFCFMNLKKYLNETTLHGLRFIGDDAITIWERLFFFISVVLALVATTHLISYIYAKWENTPIIIGISPYPTSIADIPFPAITLCNMNQLSLRKVKHYSNTSFEHALMEMACFSQDFESESKIPDHFKYNNMSLPDFLDKHAQTCSSLVISCDFNSISYNCTDLFHRSLTDEGMCCTFNILHPSFLYKMNFAGNQIMTDYSRSDGSIPVNWNPDTGYPKTLPDRYYPRPAAGIGVNMGLTIVLNAEVHDYYCASTDGPGFKFAFHSPVESASPKDNGLTVGVGEEVRFSLDPLSSSAVQNIRNLKWSARNCFFSDEGNLTYYQYFTRRNCENECQSQFINNACNCIPYNLPMLYVNATICGAPQYFCVTQAQNRWLRSKDRACRQKCINSCFDLTYLRNFYVTNIGGILSLFMGFSFISLAEFFYFACIRPIFWWILPKRQNRAVTNSNDNGSPQAPVLLSNNPQLQRVQRNAWLEPSSWERLNYRKFKGGKLKSPRELFNPSKKLQELHRPS